jgi:hypothetical protein
MAKYYVFRGITGTMQMVTNDPTGKKLPPHPYGQWVLFKEIDLVAGQHGIGGSADDIMADVARDGYYRWPQTKPGDKEEE